LGIGEDGMRRRQAVDTMIGAVGKEQGGP